MTDEERKELENSLEFLDRGNYNVRAMVYHMRFALCLVIKYLLRESKK